MKNYILRNIDIQLSDKEIFNDLSLNISSNKIYALTGASGIGKSTLLNIFSGLLLPNSGEVNSGKKISYQFQNPVLLNYLNVVENCLLGLRLTDSKEHEINLVELLYKFGFKDSDLRKYPNQLSGGMKQRISIVQTLLVHSELYLFDEPFNSIDGKSINIIIDYLWKLQRREKSTFLIVTHNLEQAITFCDEVIILKDDKSVSRIKFDDEFIGLIPSKRKSTIMYLNYFSKIIAESY